MGVFVKICGISNPADSAAVAALSPDAMGFIFWAPSKRAVSPEQVGQWVRDLPESILKVGVFVDASGDEVRRTIEVAGLQVAQCHGCESPSFCQAIDGTVWKALHLDRTEFADTEAYRVDAFLVDSYSATSPGGTGQVADWDLARRFVEFSSRPVLLAGGLTDENVGQAVAQVQPWGVDVSTGVEARPAKKDLEKVRRFITQCRS